VHGSLPMPILIPFGHPPSRSSSPRASLPRPPRFVSLSTSSGCLVLDRSLLRGRCRDRDRKTVPAKDMLDVIAIRQSEIRLQVLIVHVH